MKSQFGSSQALIYNIQLRMIFGNHYQRDTQLTKKLADDVISDVNKKLSFDQFRLYSFIIHLYCPHKTHHTMCHIAETSAVAWCGIAYVVKCLHCALSLL